MVDFKQDIGSVGGNNETTILEGGGTIDQQGRTTGRDNSKLVKWLVIGIVAVVLVVALAWGSNGFKFKGLGVKGETDPTPAATK